MNHGQVEESKVDAFKAVLPDMLELLRASVFNREPVILKGTVIDWDVLMDMSAEQNVLAWVWDGICKLPKEMQPPRQQRINWGLSAQEVWNAYEHQRMVLKDIVKVCAQNNIRILLLKGIGLSQMYPKPESRMSSDIDIFLFGDYEKGNKVLTSNSFYFGSKHSVFNYLGVTIENHQNFFIHGTKLQKRVDDYLFASTADSVLTEGGYYVLPAMAGLVHLLVHSLVHLNNPRERITIRNVVDFAYYVFYHKHHLHPEVCCKVMRELGLEKAFDLLLQLSEWVLGVDYSSFRRVLSVQSGDVDNAIALITSDTPFSNQSKNDSVIKRLSRLYKYDRATRWKYSYVPNRRVLNSGLLRVLIKSKIQYSKSKKNKVKRCFS